MQFVFRAVDEVGATLNTALVVMGDKLGLYRALAGTGGPHPGRAGRAHRDRRALRPRVAQQPGGRRLRRLRPGQRALLAAARADGRADRQRQPRLPARLLPDRARLGDRLAAHRRGGEAGQRHRLARAHARRARGLRAVLPARLQRPPANRVAAGARGCRRQARAGCARGRRRLRPRRLHGADGPGLSELARSSAPTTTRARSRRRAPAPRRPASPSASSSARSPRRNTVVRATTS